MTAFIPVYKNWRKETASSISPYYSFLIFLILFVPTATLKIYLKF